MFFRKKQEELELEAQPLHYWEELSFIIVPYIDDDISKDTIVKRLANNNIKVIGFAESCEEKPGRIVFEYENDSYEINFFEDNFELPQLYSYQKRGFTEVELNNLKRCKKAITICLEMTENFKKEYKMQLKIACSILDSFYGVLDESAEKLLHPKYVEMLASSDSLPGSKDLYNIQVISADDGSLWLHTHGLNRYGITDFEILNSNNENYTYHYNLMTTLADILINSGKSESNKYILGYISQDIPLAVTVLPWTEGLKYYKGIDLGGIADRKNEHNTNYGIVFTYDGDKSYDENRVSKLEIYDGCWDEDPIFFLSTIETNRMREVAIEEFDYVKKYFSKEDNNVIIKIGLKTDKEETDNYEFMWFELLEINDDNTFKAKLISEPYDIKSIKQGYIDTYNIDQITDWIIYLGEERYTPDKVYLLD